MAYDVWQTCVFVPGLSRGECASWVQAWGSIGAVLVAVLIPPIVERRKAIRKATFIVGNVRTIVQTLASRKLQVDLLTVSGMLSGLRSAETSHGTVNYSALPLTKAVALNGL